MSFFLFSKKRVSHFVLGSFFASTLILSFQNCGKGFQVQQNLDSNSQGLRVKECTPKQVLTCEEINGNGTKTCDDTGMYQACILDSCNAGFHLQDGMCLAEESSGLKAKSVSSGNGGTCIVTPQNTVRCWGNSSSPTMHADILGLSGIASVSSGSNFNCASTISGTVKCWGKNDSGQLGNNSNVDSEIPVDVVGISGIVAVTASRYGKYACALTNSGTVKCWGENSHGELGNNTTNNSSVPVNVVSLTGVTGISGNYNHVCVVTAEKKVKCWGYNYAGQLGNGTFTNSAVPVDVTGVTDID